MELAEKNNDKLITAEEVVDYLREHPEFFHKRDDLLLDMRLSHASGRAVSLLERQVTVLRERNENTGQRLQQLLDSARHNDKLLEKSQRLLLAMLESEDLDDIVNAFNRSLLSDFQMDFASIILFSERKSNRHNTATVISIDDAFAKIPGLLKTNNPTCGVLRPEEFAFLFNHQAPQVGSAAVIPLSHGKLLGVIAIGSKDADHFRSNMGTLFLNYIADVLNRLLPNYLD